MDKELVLQKLNELKDSLPTNLNETEDRTRSFSLVSNAFERSRASLNDLNNDEEEYYDIIQIQRDEIEIEKLTDLMNAEELSITKARQDGSSYDTMIAELENNLRSNNNVLERYSKAYERFNERYNSISESERKKLWDTPAKKRETLQNIRENIARIEEELRQRRIEKERIDAFLSSKQQKISDFQSQIDEIKSRAKAPGEIEEEKNRKRIKLENDTNALYSMMNYFGSNPREEIDNLINDIRNDNISEDEVNDRLQDINSMLSNGFYDIETPKQNLSMDEILERRRVAEQNINDLQEKTADDAYYMNKTEKYEEMLTHMSTYDNMISRLKSENLNADSDNIVRLNRIEDNNKTLAKYDELIVSKNDRIAKINNRRNISAEEKENQISYVRLELDSLENSKRILEIETKELRDKQEDYDIGTSVRNARISKYESKIAECRKALYKVDESERERDLKELEHQEAILMSTYLDERMVNNSCLSKLDELLELTGGKKMDRESEELLPSFVRNFTPEQRKLYDDFVRGMTPEEKEDLNNAYKHTFVEPKAQTRNRLPLPEILNNPAEKKESHRFTKDIPEKDDTNDFHVPTDLDNEPKDEKKEELAMVPYDEVAHTPFVAPNDEAVHTPFVAPKKSKIQRFKDASKELLDKVIIWIKDHKKLSIAAGTLLAAAALALGIKGCNVEGVSQKTPPPTPPAASDTMKPEVTPTPTPEVTATPKPTKKPETTKKPNKDFGKGDGWAPAIPVVTPPVIGEVTPDPGKTPDPGVTPAPDPTKEPEKPVVTDDNEYILSERPPGETASTPEEEKKGSSHPADPTVGYVEGEAVYNPITNTFVDSTGASTTVHEDGSATREEGTNPVEEVDENRNKVTNPDMTPVEVPVVDLPIVTTEEDVPVDAKPLEEVKTELPPEQVDAYEDAFDDAFAALEEAEEQGLGR